MVRREGFIRFGFTSAVVWVAMLILAALLLHLWSCDSSIGYLAGILDGTIFSLLMFLLIFYVHRIVVAVQNNFAALFLSEHRSRHVILMIQLTCSCRRFRQHPSILDSFTT